MNTASDTAGPQAGKFPPYGYGPHFARDGDYMWWAKTPRFNVFKLLAVIAGFMIFPPIGIAALVYFLWVGKRMRHGRDGHWAGRGCGRHHRMGRTGNSAFDEHRAKVMEELETERRAFEEFRAEKRRQRDAEAFEAFKATRKDAGDKPADGE